MFANYYESKFAWRLTFSLDLFSCYLNSFAQRRLPDFTASTRLSDRSSKCQTQRLPSQETLHCCRATSVVFSDACLIQYAVAGHPVSCPLLTTVLAKSRRESDCERHLQREQTGEQIAPITITMTNNNSNNRKNNYGILSIKRLCLLAQSVEQCSHIRIHMCIEIKIINI